MPKKNLGLRSAAARSALEMAGVPASLASMLVKAANVSQKKKKGRKQKRLVGFSGKAGDDFIVRTTVPRKAKVSRGNPKGERMSLVCKKFFASAIDPWHPDAFHCSIPAKVVGPSYKTRTVLRIVCTAGSTGLAQILVAPTLANDVNFLNVSNGATFASTGFDSAATAVTGTAWSVFGGLPFNITQLTDQTSTSNVSGRIVSIGVKVTYTGTESNKGGVYHMISFPDRNLIDGLGPSTTPAIGSYTIANVRAIDRKPIADCLFGLNPSEISFSNENEESASRVRYPLSNGAAYDTNIPCIFGIYISGATSGSTYEVEIMQHSEYVGRGAQNFLSSSAADTQMYEQLIAGLTELEYVKAGLPNGDDPAVKAKIALRSAKELAATAGPSQFTRAAYAPEGLVTLTGSGPFI